MNLSRIQNRICKAYFASILDEEEGRIYIVGKKNEYTAEISNRSIRIFTIPEETCSHAIRFHEGWRLETSNGRSAFVHETKCTVKTPKAIADRIISEILELERSLIYK